MEEIENGQLVRMVVVQPVELRCAECGDKIGEALEEMTVYCEDCFATIRDKKDELEENINKIRELTGE